MASGCIIGDCSICGELVWEDDEWRIEQDGQVEHDECSKTAAPLISRLNRTKREAEMFERHYITMRNALVEIRNISMVDDPSKELIKCFMTARKALEGHVEFTNGRRERDELAIEQEWAHRNQHSF